MRVIRGICLFGLDVSRGGSFSPQSPVSGLSYSSRWRSDRTFCPDGILPCYPPWRRCTHSGCLSSSPPPSLCSTSPSPHPSCRLSSDQSWCWLVFPTSCVYWESQSDECRDHYSRSAHSIQLQPEKGLKFEDCYFIMTIWSASHHQHVVVVGDEGKSLTFLHKHLVEIIGRFCDRQYWEEFLVDIPVVWHQHKSLPKVWVTSADRLGPS